MTVADNIAAMTAQLRAQRTGHVLPDRYRPKPDLSHLDDPGLWARIGLTDDVAGESEVAEPAKAKRKRIHKPTLASVAKQALKAGLEVARYDIDPATGKISIIPGKPEPATTMTVPQIDASEWN